MSEHRFLVLRRGQLPGAGRRWPDFGIDVNVEEKWPVRRYGMLERTAEILRSRHGERIDATCLCPSREIGVVRFLVGALVKHGAMLAAAEHAELNVPDRDPAEIVPDYPDDRNVVFDRGAQHMRNHGETAVAGHRDHR